MTQVRFSLNTTFVDTKIVARVIRFLKEEKIKREGVEIALSNFFGALAVASEGGSVEEVQALIEKSRFQFETYQNLALTRLENRVNKSHSFEEDNKSFSDNTDKVVAANLSKEKIKAIISLDEEEF
ncbi:hypothetical protein [Myxosarcina sp. GI1]|uniref:hypothetical protein n=1 Tax=Myxosarcina sp. GI1 TaxID=1541065 RepID=UPI00056536DE|nr:hypothetical protein [Myxosarcina sp. GI1]